MMNQAAALSLGHLPGSLCAILLCVSTYFLYNFFFHPLARVPGPLSARLGIPWFRTYATITRTYAWKLQSMHLKYGSVVRLGPNFVSTTDPEAVRTLYAYGSPFHKTRFYVAFSSIPSNPSLFSDIDDKSHAVRRKSVAHVYSMKQLVELESFIDPVIEELEQRIDNAINVASPEDVGSAAHILLDECFYFLLADAVGEIAFGESFGLLRVGDPSSMLLGARNLTIFGSIAGSLPRLSPIINAFFWRFYSRHSPAVIAQETIKRVDARYAEIADSSFYDPNGVPRRSDMLTGFIESKSSQTKQPFTRKNVVSMCTTVFGAGSDTTAAALMAFFYFVMRDSAVYARVEKEVDDAFEKRNIECPVSYADGSKLEYTQACLKEAMRLMTPVGMEMPRYVIPGGMVVAGRYFLSEGTEIGASAFTFHRAQATYGPDAELFRPERWLDIEGDERAMLERNNLVFGAGNRVCIGKNISLMELTKIIPTLIRRYFFVFTPRGPGSPHKRPFGRACDGVETADEPLWLNSAWFFEVSDFWVDVKRREH